MRKVLVVLGVLALNGCWWQQSGHDAGRSYWNDLESTITVDNVDDLELLWATEAVAKIGAVHNGSVYVVDQTDPPAGGSGSQLVSSIDAATGDVRWTTDLTVALDLPAGTVSIPAAPVVYNDAPYVPYHVFGSMIRFNWARLDPATGETNSTGLPPPGGILGPAAIAGDYRVYPGVFPMGNPPGSEGFLGWVPGWKYIATLSASDVADYGNHIAIVGDRVLWSLRTQATGFSPACPPAPSPSPSNWCQPDWSTELGGRPHGVARVGDTQAVYTDDTGTLTVLDVVTGAVAWTAELGLLSRPAVVGDTIFVGSGGQLLAFPSAGCGAATCTPEWRAPGGAVIAGGDVVYTSSGGSIVAYDKGGCGAATCAPIATLSVGGTTVGPAIVATGQLFGTTADGRVVAFGLPG